MGETSLEFRHTNLVKFRELVASMRLVWDLTMNKDVGLPCTNWFKVEFALLMSPKQGETSQYRDMKVA